MDKTKILKWIENEDDIIRLSSLITVISKRITEVEKLSLVAISLIGYSICLFGIISESVE